MSDEVRTRVVGVSYGELDRAPVVVLKGAGEQAKAVLADARGSNAAPIVQDAHLVSALYRVPVDSPVARELFPVMAALIIHVMRVDQAREDTQS